MTTLNGKIAVVTGGSRGLGRAIAQRLAAEGAFVAINYRSQAEQAQSAVSEIEAAGGKAVAVQGDLGSVAGVEAFFASLDAALREHTGEARFDALFNNAGINHAATLGETSEADFDRLFDLNVKGVFFTTQRALERLRDGGRIVNLGTGLTRFSFPHYAAYAATKGAVNVLTQVLAKQLGPRGITVNTLAPGACDTDMNSHYLADDANRAQLAGVTALGRVGEPEDIAGVAAFLASDDSRWVTGQRLEASGGMFL